MWATEFRNNSQTCYNSQSTVDIIKSLRLIDKEYTDKIVETTTRCERALQCMFKDIYRFAIDVPSRNIKYLVTERINITFVDHLNIIPECLHRRELPTISVLVTINTFHKITTSFNLANTPYDTYENILRARMKDVLSDVYTWYLHSVTNNKGLYE